MSKGKFITDFERTCIKIGKTRGIENSTIARALRRSPSAITAQVAKIGPDKLEKDLPFDFICDDIAEMLQRSGAIR